MAKLALTTVANLLGNPTSAATSMNNNSALIIAEMENTLSRDGTSPNQMNADFDMNHNDVLNAANIFADTLTIDGVPVSGDAGHWLSGSGIPASSLGEPKDMYINTATGDVYGPKVATTWGPIVINIKGPVGPSGSGSGDMLKATYDAGNISGNSFDGYPLNQRSDLKALSTSLFTTAFVKELGREGQFVWRTGDFSTQVTNDPQEGVYIKATAIAATVGAWVRQGEWIVRGLNSKWFGVVADATTDDTVALQASVTFAGFLGGVFVLLPAGTIRTTAVINVLSSNIKIRGAGMTTTKVAPATAGQNCFVFGDGTTILQYCGLSNLRIEPTAQISVAVKGRNYYWLELNDIQIAGLHDFGFELEKGPTASYLAIMRDCFTVNSTNYGCWLGANGTGALQNVYMYNCHFDGAGQFGVRAESISGWVWLGGETLTCGRSLGLVPAASQSVRACLFEGIFFDTATQDNIYAIISDNTRRISTVSFVNCSMNNSVNAQGISLLGLSTDNTRMDKIRFTTCEATINHGHGLYTQYCKDIDVIGCDFISNGVTAGNGVTVSDGTDGFKMIGGSSGSGSGFGSFQTYGVQLGLTSVTRVNILGVNLQGNVTGAFSNLGATNIKVKDCLGYKTRASGAGTVPVGGSVAITHGLGSTPVAVNVTPLSDPQVRYFVPLANLNASTFTVACNTPPALAWGFMWEAWSIHE